MVRKVVITWGFVLLMSLGVVSCQRSGPTEATKGAGEMSLKITSTAFQEGGMIPKKFTCDGENLSPPLFWSGIPAGTKSIAIIVDDPDAPMGTWVHWVLFNLPAETTQLAENTHITGVEGINDFKKTGYGGPCPPKGSTHRYYFKVYALDSLLGLEKGSSKKALEKAMQGHLLAKGELIGKYSR
jgi:Raf kinase inhibitor-like YbhB/YbcL family protein